MSKKNDNYSSVARSFHWLSAVLIIFMLGLGLYMTDLDYSPDKMEWYGLHKSLGVAVLTIIAARLLWVITHSYPKSLKTHKKWEKLLAKGSHILLYVAAFFMPMSGWLMSQSYGHPVSFFGWFELPVLVEKDEPMGEIFAIIHEYLAYTLIALITLHVLGALKHHFVDKDITLKRMLGFPKD